MVSLFPLFALLGTVGFLAAAVLALDFYRTRPLFRNYWLLWVVAALHLGLWSATQLLGYLEIMPGLFEGVLPLLVLTVGLTALLHVALYDNTGSETLLRQLQISEGRNSKLIDHYPDGAVVLFDRRLRVLLAGGDDLPGLGEPTDSVENDRLSTALPAPVAERLEPAARAALDGESTSFELSYEGSTYQVRAVPVGDPKRDGREGMLVVQNVTDRKQRERLLEEQRDELAMLDRINRVVRDVDHALVGARTREEVASAVADRLATDAPFCSVVVADLEPDGRLVPSAWGGDGPPDPDVAFPADGAPAARAIATGQIQIERDPDAEPLANPWRRIARTQGAGAFAVVPVHHDGRSFGVIGVFADRSEAFDDREVAVLDQFGRTVGHALTAIERRERADLLASLHRATRKLLHAETPADVGDVAVRAGTDLLDVEVAVFHYDQDDHLLKPVAASEAALDFYGETTTYGGGRESITWETFVSGDERTFDDVRTADAVETSDTDARGAMFVPLDGHGVLVAASTAVGVFDEQNGQIVDLLAATTEAAFDRLDSESGLRGREAELREQNRTLRRLRRLNDIIRDVDQALVGSSSRAEIERAVCDRLTAGDRFQLAVLYAPPGEDGTITPVAWDGEGAGYLGDVALDPNAPFQEPTARTLATGDPTVVQSFEDHVRESEWPSRGLEHGISSAVSVPVVHRGIEYGALTVYASTPDAFDDRTTTVLSELAETVAYAIDARETKRGLLSTGGTQLRLVLRDCRSVLNEFAALSDAPVRLAETHPRAGDASEVYFLASEVTPADLDALYDRLPLVTDVEAVDQQADETLYRATVSGTVLSEVVVELGGVPREIEATADRTVLVVSLLPHVEVDDFVRQVRERFPGVELDMRRELEAPSLGPSGLMEALESRLTDRQLEVLHQAYESGYFESPRESSGQDIADRLGVSQPTVNYHLRVSLRRLLSILFGERRGDETADTDA